MGLDCVVYRPGCCLTTNRHRSCDRQGRQISHKLRESSRKHQRWLIVIVCYLNNLIHQVWPTIDALATRGHAVVPRIDRLLRWIEANAWGSECVLLASYSRCCCLWKRHRDVPERYAGTSSVVPHTNSCLAFRLASPISQEREHNVAFGALLAAFAGKARITAVCAAEPTVIVVLIWLARGTAHLEIRIQNESLIALSAVRIRVLVWALRTLIASLRAVLASSGVWV